MKKAALFLTALLMLSACQKKPADSADTSKTDTAKTDTAKTDTAKTDTAKADTAKTTPAITTPGPVPAGYTLLPYLSDKPVREFKSEPAMALQDGKDYYALFDTDKGQILIDLYEQETPVTVNNFVTLARNHFYDGTRFHRVIDGFMAQGGDPQSADLSKQASWGMGGPGYQFPDEIRSKLSFATGGVLAMANSGPNTNGSQFFITFGPSEMLNGKYNIFGKVVTGDGVLPKITRTMDQSNAPIAGATADTLLTVRILTKG